VTIAGQGSGLFTNTVGNGVGGNINLHGSAIQLSNGASISATSSGRGDAGNITVNAGNQFTMMNSSITTDANQSSGGAVKITTNPSGTVQLTNSTISASVLDGAGGGGSVNIDPQFVLLQNSQILAQATQGLGGNISITTNLLLPDANSVISASSQFGVNGTVAIQSPNAPGAGEIIPLSQEPLLPTSLLNQRCASLAGGEFSSFTVAGRDSLPTEPGSWLASPLYAAGMGTGEGLSGLSSLSGVSGVVRGGLAAHQMDQIDQTDQSLLSLRQIAPAGFLTQAFAVDWSAGCQS
jgi:large exoprotein involved in heme utilization and adhesion